MGAFVLPFAFVFIAYASLAPGISAKIDPLIPALQSNWLHAHVITCFLSYASFALSCAVSILYLVKLKKQEKGRKEGSFMAMLPPLDGLDALVYKTVALGFPLLTLGIITGAAWANYAWGSVLGLGSKRDLVPDYLVCLRDFSPRPVDPGVAGQEHGNPVHRGVRGCSLYLFRGKLCSVRAALAMRNKTNSKYQIPNTKF